MECVSQMDIAYLAGLVDGEGTIYTNRIGASHSTIQLRIVNTNLEMLEWVRARCGGAIVSHPSWGALGARKVSAWCINGSQAAFLVRRLLPFLIVKRDVAIQSLADYDSLVLTMKRPGRRSAADARTAEAMSVLGW